MVLKISALTYAHVMLIFTTLWSLWALSPWKVFPFV